MCQDDRKLRSIVLETILDRLDAIFSCLDLRESKQGFMRRLMARFSTVAITSDA